MKLPYSEGSAFLVPLRDGGYARGVVARAAPRGRILLGYFFGPRLESPEFAVLDDLDPAKAVLRIRFGDLGLMDGTWAVLGKVPFWNREEWPMPDFVRQDPISKKTVLVRYSDKDPRRIKLEHRTDFAPRLPKDGLYGSGAVEIVLTKRVD